MSAGKSLGHRTNTAGAAALGWRQQALSRRSLLTAGAALGAGFALGGCGGDSKKAATGSQTSLSQPTTKPDRLVVRAWGDPWSTSIQKYAGSAFTDQTGIPIKYDLSDAGEVQAKIKQALDAGQRPPVDAVYTIGTLAYTASVQKLLVPLDTDVVTNFELLTKPGYPVDGTDYVNLYTYLMPMMFNPKRTSFEAGQSWMTLSDSKYDGILYAGSGFQAMTYPIAVALGIDMANDDMQPVWDAIAKFRPNVSAIGDDTTFIETMKSGNTAIGSALVGDGLAVKDGGTDVEWVVPKEGGSLLADSIYVCAGIPDDVAYYAQVFVNHLIDAKLQSEWCAPVATVPTNKNATPAPFMKGDPAFPFTDEELAQYAVIEPVEVVAEKFDEWNTAYTAVITN